MAFVPAPNIVMVEARCLLAGQMIENRWMVDALTTVDAGIVQEVAGVVSAWVRGNYFDQMTDDVTLTEIVATDMSTQNGTQFVIVPETTEAGAIAGGTMPNEVTMCVSLRTGNRGRSARGRTYVLTVPRTKVSGNNIDATWAGLVKASFEDLVSELDAAGFKLAIVSYRANKAPRPGGPVYFFVTDIVITDLVVDSMRSRKPGVGS